MSKFVNFIVGGMLGFLMVRKMSNSHNFSFQRDRNGHHHTRHSETNSVNNVHR